MDKDGANIEEISFFARHYLNADETGTSVPARRMVGKFNQVELSVCVEEDVRARRWPTKVRISICNWCSEEGEVFSRCCQLLKVY